ncbi:PREDICTED: carboxy-terminal domain RNA polymerase II polypeptide A small phosphatase 1-like [Tarenaya hassleriana]|uniref:carboxy-terminal domain RNA polymerase II polypeptide A small phosphatase 1-like n=1 Tax=Tarenaya hassleriana TaxID=28532 RepID=UPI00053C87BA|nr:PREDICTED: carboxy-terminal domain RNA polymerase II polypeptide A small phosphatase 1-like [Tarenaya hassleriana]
MATKLIKKTTTPIKRHHRHNLRRHNRRGYSQNQPRCTPEAATTVVASVNKSFYKCHRVLLRLFSRLPELDSIRCRSICSTNGFQILENHIDPVPKSPHFNPLLSLIDDEDEKFEDSAENRKKKEKTIVLDLDETLIHSSTERPEGPYDFVVRPRIDGQMLTFFVIKRPGVDEFLRKIGEKYTVVVFTAGLPEYASMVLDHLDPRRRVISHRLFRNSCTIMDGRLVKDLGRVVGDMRRVVIVDDNPNSYALQPENAFPIKPFTDDLMDEELRKLGAFFDDCDGFDDMRVALKQLVGRDE